jgi:hypothetical protein
MRNSADDARRGEVTLHLAPSRAKLARKPAQAQVFAATADAQHVARRARTELLQDQNVFDLVAFPRALVRVDRTVPKLLNELDRQRPPRGLRGIYQGVERVDLEAALRERARERRLGGGPADVVGIQSK